MGGKAISSAHSEVMMLLRLIEVYHDNTRRTGSCTDSGTPGRVVRGSLTLGRSQNRT